MTTLVKKDKKKIAAAAQCCAKQSKIEAGCHD